MDATKLSKGMGSIINEDRTAYKEAKRLKELRKKDASLINNLKNDVEELKKQVQLLLILNDQG